MKELLKTLCELIKNHINQKNRQYIIQQGVNKQNAISNTGMYIPNELYEALRQGNYPLIQPIQSCRNFRFNSWVKSKGIILYKYRLQKVNIQQPIANIVLQQMMVNMNKDIASAQNELINLYGHEYVSAFYWCIYYGMYIMAIKDVGMEIEITVVLQ